MGTHMGWPGGGLGAGVRAQRTAHCPQGVNSPKKPRAEGKGHSKQKSKSFCKKIDKKSKNRFFSIFFIMFVGVSRRGGSKSPGTFLAPEEPISRPCQGPFFFEGRLSAACHHI